MTSAPTFELPRTLERPALCSEAASRLTLDALEPELTDLPLPFIQHQLTLHTEQMLAGLRDLPVPSTIPPARLPSALAVVLPQHSSNTDLIYPTHVLAVSLPTAPPDAPVALIPVHGIVFAAHCTAPILHRAPPNEDPPGTLRLPVCPVVLPSVPALVAIRRYIYTQRIDLLFATFLPLPAPLTHPAIVAALESSETQLRLATHLVSARPGVAHLLGYAACVRDVWRTACGLGMYDIELWDALDLAWELIIAALNIAIDASKKVT
ncbi:hypothetical protein DFH06DRAFT_1217697 [Mycena polygramma]|nr:hypothetical protein DFH06DRAFT_1217697 [Mycena polygramma]